MMNNNNNKIYSLINFKMVIKFLKLILQEEEALFIYNKNNNSMYKNLAIIISIFIIKSEFNILRNQFKITRRL